MGANTEMGENIKVGIDRPVVMDTFPYERLYAVSTVVTMMLNMSNGGLSSLTAYRNLKDILFFLTESILDVIGPAKVK